MKKLMTVLSAAALALGAFADVTYHNESFEDGTLSAAWSSDVGESSIVNENYTQKAGEIAAHAEADHYKVLNVKTAFSTPAWCNAADAGTADMDGLYFDSYVKFTACDEDVTISDAKAKIAVWIKEMTSGDTVTGTNLFITAGTVGGTAQNYDCGPINGYNIESDGWARLTIKMIADATSDKGIRSFVVFVNALSAVCTTSKGYTYSELTGQARRWYNANALFPSMDQSTANISQVGFAGQGCVDDLSFTKSVPEFAKDYDMFSITWDDDVTSVSIDGATIVGKQADVLLDTVPKQITANVTYADGKMADTWDVSGVGNTVNGNVFTANATGTGTIKAKNVGAYIGDTPYGTVAEAVTAINGMSVAGTYTLMLNTSCDQALSFKNQNTGVNIVLDLAGQAITSEGDAAIAVGESTTLLITNSTITVGTIANNNAPAVSSEGTLTFSAGDITAGAVDGTGIIVTGGRINTKENASILNVVTVVPDTKTLVEGTGGDAGYWIVADKPKASFIMQLVDNTTPQYKVGEGAWTTYTTTVEFDAPTAVQWKYVAAANYRTTGEASGTKEVALGATCTVGDGIGTQYLGQGTEADPYLIYNKDDLVTLQTEVKGGASKSGVYYKQTANIDMSSIASWDGIGDFGKITVTHKFSGNYDGNGFAITGVNFAAGSYGGFFGCCSGATIKNLSITVTSIPTIGTGTGKEYGYAAFAGTAANTTFEGCTAKGNIGSDSDGITHTGAGFLVKADNSGKVTFRNCTNELNIVVDYWDNPKVGGIIGISENAEVIGCVNKGSIKSLVNKAGAEGTGIGGIIGYMQSNPNTITDCINEGTITLVDNATSHGQTKTILIKYGSIIGSIGSSTLTASGCKAQADMISSSQAIAGLKFATVADGVATFVADNAVTAGAYKVMAPNAAFSYSFADQAIGSKLAVTFDKTLVPAFNPTFTGADDAQVVAGDDGYTLALKGDGTTEATAFEVSTVRTITSIKDQVAGGDTFAGKFIKQTADLDMTEAGAWAGIGTYEESADGTIFFAGTYDGNGYQISNLKLEAKKYTGFFNQVVGGTVKGIKMNTVTFADGATFGGGMIVCNARKGTLVKGCATFGTFGSAERPLSHNAAGIVCRASTATVDSCTNNAVIVGSYTKVAGIVVITQPNGDAGTVTIKDCVNNGSVTQTGATSNNGGVAGILGYNGGVPVVIQNCVNTGVITTDLTDCHIGSIVGLNQSGSITATGCVAQDSIKSGDFSGTVTGLYFATVNGGVATFVDAVAGGSYKVMAAGAAVSLANAGNTITLDETLATASVTTTAAGYEVTKAGNVYTVTAKTLNITYAYTTNGVAVAAADLKDLVNTERTTFTVLENVEFDTSKITLTDYTLKSVEPASWNAGDKTADVTVTVAFDVIVKGSGVAPGGSPVDVKADSPEAATNGVEVVVTTPDETKVSTAEYKEYFYVKATDIGGGSYRLTAELKPEIVKAEPETTQVAATLSDVAAGTAESATVTNAKPGLYYSVKYTNDLSSFKTAAEGDRAQADSDGTVTIPMPKTSDSASAQFYQIQVNTTAKEIVQ